MPVIVVTSRDGVQTYVLEEGKPLFLGRASDCDAILPSTAVSRRHAVIMCKNGVCGVKDLGSFNGTLLNDELIQEPKRLLPNDVLKISSFVIRLHAKDPSLSAQETGSEDSAATGTRAVRLDSRKFENSGLPLPRAMQHAQALNNDLQQVPVNSPGATRDTQAFLPGVETNEFMKAAPAPETDQDAGGYFTPFPVPEGETQTASASAPAPRDIADFEESPLAPLENIGDPEDKAPTPFLASAENFDAAAEFVASLQSDAEAVIPLGPHDYAEEMASYSSEAEAIIPLMDDTPLVTTLSGDPPEGGAAARNRTSSGPGLDTAMYTLTPEAGEPETGSDTGTYLVAEVRDIPTGENEIPVVPDDTEPAISEKAMETGEQQAVPPPEEGFDDNFGEEPRQAASDSSRVVANVGGVADKQTSIKAKSSLSGIASLTISSSLMAAINTRLSLYSLLYDLVEERKRYRQNHPKLPEDVEAELDRQDHELDNLPTAEEAERQLQLLNERNIELEEAIVKAEEIGLPGPPEATPEMLAAEDFAVTQWLLISDSNRQALPAIYREAYTLAQEEPLSKELSSARISHGRLMGGGIYLLALEALASMANTERFRIAKKVKKLQEGEKEGPGLIGKLGAFGKMAANFASRTSTRDELARLAEEDRMNAIRAELANREAAFMEKTLIREFRQVYKKVALRYIPDFDSMPVPIRAFLRHGVIGIAPWWLTKDAREYVIRDCTDNIVPEFSHGTGDINVLYADEYLFAVSQMECTPSPDEDLMASSVNTAEWKTDRAYRRIVNARSYNEMMEEMINQLNLTGKYLDDEAAAVEKQINVIKNRGFSGSGEHLFELQTQQAQCLSRRENIARNMKRIQEELIPSILEAIEDAERRFRTGDLRIPDQETLVRREIDSIFRLQRRLEEDKERFMPMVVREHYRFRSDTINDRAAIRSILVKMEELDPNIFMRTIIPSKHKRNRVDLRMSPTVVLLPAAGQSCCCSMGREGMESGHLVVPTCFLRAGVRSRHITHMLADFRWETSRMAAGRDVMKSDTLAGAFTKIRWQSRQLPRNRREKQMLFTESGEKENWRRVYEVYLPDALNGGRLLFQRNPDLYEAVIGKYIDPPEGVRILRRSVI